MVTNQAHFLLQSNCGLQFDNQVLSFSSCQNVTSQLGTDYNLLWTVVSEGNGNSTFRGAIDAAASSQIEWAGFGFAVPGTQQMLGGSALIVKECQTCSSGEPSSLHSPALVCVCDALSAGEPWWKHHHSRASIHSLTSTWRAHRQGVPGLQLR